VIELMNKDQNNLENEAQIIDILHTSEESGISDLSVLDIMQNVKERLKQKGRL